MLAARFPLHTVYYKKGDEYAMMIVCAYVYAQTKSSGCNPEGIFCWLVAF